MRICGGTSCSLRPGGGATTRALAAAATLLFSSCRDASAPDLAPYAVDVAAQSGDGTIVAVNDSGVVLATSGGVASLWRSGEETRIPDCEPTDLDNLRRVACRIVSLSAPGVWHDGIMTRLPADTAFTGRAFGISDAGFVGLEVSAGSGSSLRVWKLGAGTIKARDSFSGNVARGVSNTGVIAWTAPNGLYPGAFIWGAGITAGGGRVSGASFVSDGGYVGGSVEISPSQPGKHAATVWAPPSYGGVEGPAGSLVAVDDRGHAIVVTETGRALWQGSRVVPLTALAPPEWELLSLAAISSSGVIAAKARSTVTGGVSLVVLRRRA